MKEVKRFSCLDDLRSTEPKQRPMTCLAGLSQSCNRSFFTTPEKRICPRCREYIRTANLTAGVESKGASYG